MQKFRTFFFTFFFIIAGISPSFGEELGLSLRGGIANLNTVKSGGLWGPGLQLGLSYSLNDFWQIDIVGSVSHHFESTVDVKDETLTLPADTVASTSLRLVYLIDIIEYIPYFGLGPAFYFDVPRVDDAEAQTNLGASLIIGLDWRYSRESSIGAFGELHAMATDVERYPVYSFVGVCWTRHFRF